MGLVPTIQEFLPGWSNYLMIPIFFAVSDNLHLVSDEAKEFKQTFTPYRMIRMTKQLLLKLSIGSKNRIGGYPRLNLQGDSSPMVPIYTITILYSCSYANWLHY